MKIGIKNKYLIKGEMVMGFHELFIKFMNYANLQALRNECTGRKAIYIRKPSDMKDWVHYYCDIPRDQIEKATMKELLNYAIRNMP